MVESLDDSRAQMFPTLAPAQIARIASHAKRRSVAEGEVLFEQGQPVSNVYVVLSGTIEVVRPAAMGTENTITTHQPGEFTGEVNVLSGRRSLVRGQMKTAGEILV